MEFGLRGRHVAILGADGVDGAQLAARRKALVGAGAIADVVAPHAGEIRGADGEGAAVDQTLDVCRAADYDALVIPGGRQATDALRNEPRAVQLVREFMAADKPVAAIGDGVRLLIAADALAGRTVSAAPELADEVRGVGGQPTDAPLSVDEKLVTGRAGGESAGLDAVILREFANRLDEARVDELSEQSFPASDPPPGPVAVGGEGASTALHLDSGAADRGRSSPDTEARS